MLGGLDPLPSVEKTFFDNMVLRQIFNMRRRREGGRGEEGWGGGGGGGCRGGGGVIQNSWKTVNARKMFQGT